MFLLRASILKMLRARNLLLWGIDSPSVWVFLGGLSSQSEKPIERDMLLKRLEIRS